MRTADVVVDIGPGAGAEGGEILTVGHARRHHRQPAVGDRRLSLRTQVHPNAPPPARCRAAGSKCATRAPTTLRGIDVAFRSASFCAVTGVSGSGKSTLVNEVLVRALNQHLHGQPPGGTYGTVKGAGQLDKLVVIDQSPIGRTPRSNPATYTGTFDYIRELFSKVPEARMRGYAPGRFSFNVKGGRCEACQGDGIIKIEMHFLPDVYVPCEVCKGKRYNAQTLEVKYQGQDDLRRARDARRRGGAVLRRTSRAFTTSCRRSATSASATSRWGSRRRRFRAARRSASSSPPNSRAARPAARSTCSTNRRPVCILPTSTSCSTCCSAWCSWATRVLVIEHNLDVIKTADYLIDLGPEGGDRGGTVVASGTPEEVAANAASYTGQYLAPVLRDQRAVGHHLPDDAELSTSRAQNLLVLDDLAKSDRVRLVRGLVGCHPGLSKGNRVKTYGASRQ